MRAWLLIALAGIAACRVEPVEPLTLNVTLKVEPATVAVGDSVRVELNAQGGALIGVSINYGDGHSDEVNAGGSHTARLIRRHAYARSGVYEVIATAVDAAQGDKTATARVEVRQP